MSNAGGRRSAAGRPKGALSKVTAKAKQAAMETGLLPHQWLLAVCRGEPITHKVWQTQTIDGEEVKVLVEEVVYADFATRVDAAKAAAPFYAPKLATQTVSLTNNMDSVGDALKIIAEKLPV